MSKIYRAEDLGIVLTDQKVKRSKYPWYTMEIGEMFKMHATENSARSMVVQTNKKSARVFQVHVVDGQVFCARLK